MIDENLAATLRGFNRDKQFVDFACGRLTKVEKPPRRLGKCARSPRGYPIAEVRAAALHWSIEGPFKDDPAVKDCMIYLLVPDDFSAGRAGEGQDIRPLMCMTAYLINAVPEYIEPIRARRQNPHAWSQPRALWNMIDANGARINYIVLAERLTKAQAKYGQDAVMALLGLRKHGGWLVNELYN